jgi:DNA-directed RNA polymerase subunit L
MQLRVIEYDDVDDDDDEGELIIEIAGEDHTFMNVLKGALLETEGVSAATYDVNPEQSGGQTDPVLTLKTENGVGPLQALETSADRVVDKATTFNDAYRSAARSA